MVVFCHRPYCTVALNSNFAILKTLFSIRVKELFKPLVLQNKQNLERKFCILKINLLETKVAVPKIISHVSYIHVCKKIFKFKLELRAYNWQN